MIPVTKPYLPRQAKLNNYIAGIYERNWLTNNGPLVQELTSRLEQYLGVQNLLLVANGTLALQIAYRALDVSCNDSSASPQAITTPFSFIATTSSLSWEGVNPKFVDIDPATWCLDSSKLEAAIEANTRAIVPVHVFGNACDVDRIDNIGKRHNLKVVYDASHAFGVRLRGESLLNYGDASTLSFHATKLFHTGEGGAIVFKNKEDFERAKMMINFGITGPESIECIGINAKMNEFQAAIGLCMLDEMDRNLHLRSVVWNAYRDAFCDSFQMQLLQDELEFNYSYFPIVFNTQTEALRVLEHLKAHGVGARRYFYPSLDTIADLSSKGRNAVSNNIAERILCLPLYADLPLEDVSSIIDIVNGAVK
jgi:dTDP-4-amino-4,6-dideoxygalactose transaminase